MKNVIFEFYIGDTYPRDIIIDGYSEEISEMYFTIKKNNNDKRYVLQKTLTGGGITLVDVTYGTDGSIISRTYNLLINADDTEDMNPEVDYDFDIEIVTPGVSEIDIKKTIITGIFRLTNTTTRKYNEV